MTERSTTISVLQATKDGPRHPLEELLQPRTDASIPGSPTRIHVARIGRLVGLTNDGEVPLVTYPDQPVSTALPARAMLDLHGTHIGRDCVLLFEDGDPGRPIIVGCLQTPRMQSLPDVPGHVEIDRDGQRLLLSAREQIVLKCGKASITLTRAGKIILAGTYVSNRSSGVLRLKGGSVQIN